MKIKKSRNLTTIVKYDGRKKLLLNVIIIVVLAIGAIAWGRNYYEMNLKAVSSNQTTQLVTIPNGSSVSQIAQQLKNDNLIRNRLVFEEYINNQNARSKLQAGTYAIAPSRDVAGIVNILINGRVATKLVTILPDRRIDQVRADLINSGFSPASVDQALQPDQYQSLPVMAFKPAGANLEGLLYPDSWEKTAGTDPSFIIRESLTEMGQHLTQDIQAAFAKESLTVYQGIILSSIVEQEVATPTDRTQVAQVFLLRLQNGMKLESNVTAYYGAVLAGKPPTPDAVSLDTPYNTYMHPGLTPGPISDVNDQALSAVAHPATTMWLYFVTGKNGVTHFSQTIDEHNTQIQQYGQSAQ